MALLKKIYLPLACLLISLGAALSATNASASTIVFSSTGNNDAKLIPSSDSNMDMLVPSIPNSTGTSFTRLTSFSVDRPLKIINAPDTHGNTTNPTAKLIIIASTSTINLRSNIEIVGETADLLILGGNAGSQFYCTSCSFTNMGRVSLAAAGMSSNFLNDLGTLTPTPSIPTTIMGQPTTLNPYVTISGLSTDRVASLELIGNYISLSGAINTQARGSQLSDGSYQLNPNGGLVIGSGGFNVFNGFTISYSNLELGLPQASSSFAMSSSTKITSQAVHISTAKTFNMVGDISTKSDVATAVNYRNGLSAVEESIKIYSFSDIGTSLVIGGTMYSDNLIDVRSASGLIFNGYIQAAGLMGIAGDKSKLIQNAGGSMFLPGDAARWDVSAVGNPFLASNASCPNTSTTGSMVAICLSAFFSAGQIENNGTIRGKSVVMAAVSELQNRYGGKIFADNIQLSSQSSFIRNGSQYPFKPKAEQPQFIAPIDPNKIPLGTVTIDGIPFLNALEGASRVDSTALILGKNIKITASSNIENVNPYVEVTTVPSAWDNGVVFSLLKASRVQILAENNLDLDAGVYLLNSSAYMGVSNAKGKFYVSSGSIANQRYSTQAAITEFANTTDAVTNIGTKSALMVYSPPGVIYSFSPMTFMIKAGGSLVNNTSYFEALSDATFNNIGDKRIINIGMNLQSLVSSSVNNEYVKCIRNISGSLPEAEHRLATANCNSAYGGTTIAPGSVIEAQQGTLFYVKGRLNGDTADLLVTNHNVLTDMNHQAVSDYLLANSLAKSAVYSRSETPQVQNGGTVKWTYARAIKLSDDGKNFITYDKVLTRDDSACSGDKSGCRSYGVDSTNAVKTETVLDVLKRIFTEMKDALILAINKLLQYL